MQAPPSRTALLPAADSALNSRSSTPSEPRKRKREDAENTNTFTAKSVDTKAKPSTVTFNPVILIPRANIPLVWLAPAASYRTLSSPYLFEAHILPAWQHNGCALVARLSPNGGLYAIEKANQRSWVACRLSSWITEEHCRDAAAGQVKLLEHDTITSSHERHKRSDSQSTTASGRPLTPCSPKQPKNKRGALARMSILSSRDSQDQPQSVEEQTPDLLDSPRVVSAELEDTSVMPDSQGDPLEPLPFLETQSKAEAASDPMKPIVEPVVLSVEAQPHQVQQKDQLSYEHVVQQFLDNLYLSRTSLAFYAKGPLSRARAQAKSGDSDMSFADLSDVYRSCIVPAKKSDTKYKESLPDAIKILTSTAGTDDGAKMREKRPPKKVKLRKDGLYNCENQAIKEWWHSRDVGNSSIRNHEAASTEVRKAISELRTRETQMQLLLILEVLTLELAQSQKATAVSASEGTTVKTEALEDDPVQVLAQTPKVKKKPRNLQAELDAIVDKLCIWHTVSNDDLLDSANHAQDGGDTATKSNDQLKEFCSEVIKPFYGSKLPDQVKALCRKLAGTEISPQRPRPSSSKSKTLVKPAQDSKPKPRVNSQRALERVLNQDQGARHGSPPTLSRSSTVPNLKRERSMSNLQREPSDLSARPASRGGIQKSVSFMGREIDLIADAKAHEVKKRKLDRINTQQNELKAAIEALKKPNRSDTAKTIMDEVEQRKSVQITATPGRRKAGQLLKLRHQLLGLDDDDEEPMEEIDPVIPSSTIKPMLVPNMTRSSTKKRAVLGTLGETPSRGLRNTSDPLHLSPTAPSSGTIAATPATNRLRPDLPPYPMETPVPKMRKSGRAVLFTPLKRTDVNVQNIFRDAPVIPAEAGKAMDRVMGGKGAGEELNLDANLNLYDQLGWNDDEEDI